MTNMIPRQAVAIAAVFLILIFAGISRLSGPPNGGADHSPLAQSSAFPPEQLDKMALAIRAGGYSCKTALSARSMLVGIGFVVRCAGDRPNAEYWYDVEDRGGRWTISLR